VTEHEQLVARIRANCNPITGLSKSELEKHIDGIVRVVEMTWRRKRR